MKNKLMIAALALTMATPAMANHHEDGKMHDKNMGEKHAAWFASVDSDNDGMLSRAEIMADSELRFNTMDADDDGMISQEEAHENKFWHNMGENIKKEYKEMKHDMKEAMDTDIDADVDADVEADVETDTDM